MKHFDSKKRHFIVMLKLIHPTDHTVMRPVSACVIGYAIWISIGCHAAMTGCISNAHAICDTPSLSFDEENKVWGALYSDRWEMQFPHLTTICSAFSILISNQRLKWNFMDLVKLGAPPWAFWGWLSSLCLILWSPFTTCLLRLAEQSYSWSVTYHK